LDEHGRTSHGRPDLRPMKSRAFVRAKMEGKSADRGPTRWDDS